MEKENKTRTMCMNCLHSVITKKHEQDPKDARLIVTYSCDKCCSEDTDILFFSHTMRELNDEVQERISKASDGLKLDKTSYDKFYGKNE